MTPCPIDRLLEFLAAHPPGPISLASDIEKHLAQGWDDLTGYDGGMTGMKLLGRMENVSWQPPRIIFRIERHGATVMGSSRAEVQEWTIDLEERTKTLRTVGRRQVRLMQGGFDVQPLADEIAAAILAGRLDDFLKWDGTDHVRLLIGHVLPEGSAVKETLAGRRKRLREAVAAQIAKAGWVMIRANVFKNPALDRIQALYEKDKQRLAQYAVTPVRSVLLTGVDPNAVYPHECYFRAYQYATHLDRLDESGILLVHGECDLCVGGHAWVELADDLVFDAVFQAFYPRSVWYEELSARPWYKFTPDAAFRLACRINGKATTEFDYCWHTALRLPWAKKATNPLVIDEDKAEELLVARGL